MLLESVCRCDDSSDAVHERVTRLLVSRGYRRQGAVLVRGSWWGTLTALNPKKWMVQATLETSAPGEHRLRFEINTTGHMMLTDAERKFWKDELEGARRVLAGEHAPLLDGVESKAVASSVGLMKLTLGYSVAFAIGFGVLQYFAFLKGIRLPGAFVGVGGGIGVGVGLQKWRENQARKSGKLEAGNKP